MHNEFRGKRSAALSTIVVLFAACSSRAPRVATVTTTSMAPSTTTSTAPSTTSTTTTTASSTTTTLRRTSTTTAPRPTTSTTRVVRQVHGLQGAVVAVDPGHNGGNGSQPSEINRQVDARGFKKACDTTGTQTASGYTEAAYTFDLATRLAAV